MIRETNYCAHAIDDLQRHIKNAQNRGASQSRDVLSGVSALLRNAVKFRLPDNGKIIGLSLNDAKKAIVEFNRLPYPIIALEYYMTDKPADSGAVYVPCPERILICVQSPDDEWPIIIQCLVRMNDAWVPFPAAGRLHRSGDYIGIVLNVLLCGLYCLRLRSYVNDLVCSLESNRKLRGCCTDEP